MSQVCKNNNNTGQGSRAIDEKLFAMSKCFQNMFK